jgi:hypothetical protein
MSVVHVGAYAWSYSNAGSSPSSSTSGSTSGSGVSVSVSNSPCSSCSAISTSVGSSLQANAYGGSMSVVHLGAYAWSFSNGGSSLSSSMSGATSAIGFNVSVGDVSCAHCSAVSTSGQNSFQANAYGGSMSVVHVGAYAWSCSNDGSSPSSSTSGSTSGSGFSVSVSDSPCSNCSAMTSSSTYLFQANAYGGSMSVVHVGAYAWSISNDGSSPSSSTCGSTSGSGVNVSVSNSTCFNCSAITTCYQNSNPANAYGGSMSVVHVGAYAWSFAAEGSFRLSSRSYSNSTRVINLSFSIANSSMLLTKASSSKCYKFKFSFSCHM